MIIIYVKYRQNGALAKRTYSRAPLRLCKAIIVECGQLFPLVMTSYPLLSTPISRTRIVFCTCARWQFLIPFIWLIIDPQANGFEITDRRCGASAGGGSGRLLVIGHETRLFRSTIEYSGRKQPNCRCCGTINQPTSRFFLFFEL